MSPNNILAGVDANLPINVNSAKIPTIGIGNGNTSHRNSNKIIPVPDRDVEIHAPHISLPIAHPTIRQYAITLANLIEGSEKNVGAYVKLLQENDLCAIKAGVIATLLRKYFTGGRQALRAPGGYYTRQVQQFQKAIPEHIAELLDVYAHSSYEEIEAALKMQAQAQAVHRQSGAFGSSRSRTQPTIRQGQPMDAGMARTLMRRIVAEDPHVQVKDICKLEDGTYAVNVFIDPVEHKFYSIEEWDTYHAQMQMIEQEASR